MPVVTPVVQILYSDGALTDVHRWANLVGTPISAAARRLDGREVSGVYTISFANVVAGVSADATVTATTSLNSQHLRVVPVSLAPGNVNTDLIRGWEITLNSAGGFLSSWSGKITAGLWEGAADAGNPSGVILNETTGPNSPGVQSGQGAGAPAYKTRLLVKNISSEKLVDTYAELLPWAVYKPTSGTKGLYFVDNTSALILEKAEGGFGQKVLPYLVTFANLVVGPPKTIDVRFDGAVLAGGVLNTSTGAPPSSSAALAADGVTKYQVTTGALTGLEFIVDAGVLATDTADLFVYGVRWAQIAADIGTPVYGTTPVLLTQTGQVAGEILPGGSAPVLFRSLIPAGAPYGKNPHPQGFRVRAKLAGATGA